MIDIYDDQTFDLKTTVDIWMKIYGLGWMWFQ